MTQDEKANNPRLATLGLLVQAMKFEYLENYDILRSTTKNGKALPNVAGKLADQLRILCERDTAILSKLITSSGGDEDPVYGSVWDAQALVHEVIETIMELSAQMHQKEPTKFTGGVASFREILKAIRAGEMALVEPKQYEGLVRTGMLHPAEI